MQESSHIVCPHCGAVNRIPLSKDSAAASCGRCHKKLFMGQPLSVDTERFDKHLRRDDIPLVVDFWASWCGPCKMMAPEFEKAASMLEPRFRLMKVNTEDNPVLSARYGIRSIPTLIVFKDGKEVMRQSGAMSSHDIVAWAQFLKK